MSHHNAYAVLGVPRHADAAVIRQAYKQLALVWHPDKCRDPAAPDRFALIRTSYATLSDPVKRAQHDAELRVTASPDVPLAPMELLVTLDQLVLGFKKKLRVTHTFPLADGSAVELAAVVVVQSEPGWRSGHVVTFPGVFADEAHGIAAQDLAVRVAVEPHALYAPRGGDVLVRHMPVSLLEALFGLTCAVTLLDGTNVVIPIFAVTTGLEVEVPAQGLPREDGSRGPLMLAFQILGAPSPMPHDWRRAVFTCLLCARKYCERDNSDSACMSHPGRIVVQSGPPVGGDAASSDGRQFQVWDCCNAAIVPPTRGCCNNGKHLVDPTASTAARCQYALKNLSVALVTRDVLLFAHALVDCRDASLADILTAAVSGGHVTCVALLLRLGVDTERGGGSPRILATALRNCADNDFEAEILAVLTATLDADPSERASRPARAEMQARLLVSMPLVPPCLFGEAARRRDAALALALLRNPFFGAQKCQLVANTKTTGQLLLHSILSENEALLRELLEHGANVNTTDPSTGSTLLHQTVGARNATLTSVLVRHHPDFQLRNLAGQRPLDLALEGALPGALDDPVSVGRELSVAMIVELAMLSAAIASPAAASLIRVAREFVDNSLLSESDVGRWMTTLDEVTAALRKLCAFTEGLVGVVGNDDSAPSTTESAWRRVTNMFADWQASSKINQRHLARSLVRNVIVAGVAAKRDLQEWLADVDYSMV